MQWLAIGDARVQVLGGMMHDPKAAKRTFDAIASLRPSVVIADRSIAEWDKLDITDPLQSLVLGQVPGPWQVNALWRATADACRRIGAETVLLHRELPVVPKKGIKQLRRLLKKEGFTTSRDAAADLTNLYRHYILRVPELWQHIEERRDRTAARLRAALDVRPRDAVVVLAQPDIDEVVERIRSLSASAAFI